MYYYDMTQLYYAMRTDAQILVRHFMPLCPLRFSVGWLGGGGGDRGGGGCCLSINNASSFTPAPLRTTSSEYVSSAGKRKT